MAKKTHPKRGSRHQAKSKPGSKNLTASKTRPGSMIVHWVPWVILGLSALIFLHARIRLLAIPLERDEGSFAYIGHYLLRGRELYTDMLDSKLPGLYAFYGFFTSLFGYHSTGVHIGLLVANGVSAFCFYILTKELYNRFVASIATSFFLFLIISMNVVGFAAHATQLLTPFVLGGVVLFWRGIHSGKVVLFFLAGLLIGIAFTIKQQAAIYGIVLAAFWWPARWKWYKKDYVKFPLTEWLALGIGGFLPLVVVVAYFGWVGMLDEFYNWSVLQPFNLAGSFGTPRFKILLNTVPRVLDRFEGLWILAGAGLFLIFRSGWKKEAPLFGVFFTLAGITSVAIGAGYYKHYFVLAMPGIALLASCTLYWLTQTTGKHGVWISLSIAVMLIGYSMKDRIDYFFNPDFAKIHFEVYGYNLFPELEKIGKELAKRVPPGERIGIMGSEPEVLVAAGRESCSKHLMIYALLSDPELSPPMQQEYIREMQTCAPEYIVWNTGSGSWTKGYDKLRFFLQLQQWVDQHYETIGLAESQKEKPGVIVWDDAVKPHLSKSNFNIIVFRKKTTAVSPANG